MIMARISMVIRVIASRRNLIQSGIAQNGEIVGHADRFRAGRSSCSMNLLWGDRADVAHLHGRSCGISEINPAASPLAASQPCVGVSRNSPAIAALQCQAIIASRR
jgi:hypothetical protein